MSNNEFSLFNAPIMKEILNRENLVETCSITYERNGFNLLESFRNNVNSLNLEEIKNFDKSHSQLFPKKDIINEFDIFPLENDYIIELKNKNNFFKDSFFNQILSKEESKISFEKINSNKNFETKFNMDMNNSSKYFCYDILKMINKTIKKNELQEKLKNQINKLTPFEKENSSLLSITYQVPKEIKEIKYYKKVKPNGDSFYTSFIYQYVRNLIPEGNGLIISRIINLEKEYHILSPISGDINQIELGKEYLKETESFNLKELKNLGQAFFYLGIIYNLITAENDIINAVKMFKLAFSYDKIFSKLLCIFMKSHIKQFLRKNREFFNIENYCIKHKLIPEKYFFPQNKKFNYELYINDYISINQKEPSLFIISIIPYIFNVKLNLYINEEGSEPEDINKLFKIEINPNKNDDYDIMNINILYSSHSYHIIESKVDDNMDINEKINFDICSIFSQTKGNEEKFNKNKEDYIKFEIKEKCKKCSNNEYIILKRISNCYPICLKCFKSLIDDILIKRYQNMIKEKFNFVEFYLKEIPLSYLEKSNDYINLSQTEFFYIFNQNLYDYFRYLINNVCDLCGILQKNKKIIHKICGCKYCIKCAKKECKILIFSNFEKNIVYKNKKLKCKCGKEIEIINYASQIFNMLNSDEKFSCEKEMEKRIKTNIENYCMKCGHELGRNLISKNKKSYFSYNLKDIDLIKGAENIEHHFCEDCVEENLKNNNNKIYCIICDREHNFNNDIKNKSIRAPIKSSDINTEIILRNKQEEGRKLKEDKEEKEEKEENLKPNGESHLNNINDILSNNDKDSVINSYNQNLKNEEENETKEEIKEETKKEIEEEIKIKVNNDLNKENTELNNEKDKDNKQKNNNLNKNVLSQNSLNNNKRKHDNCIYCQNNCIIF